MNISQKDCLYYIIIAYPRQQKALLFTKGAKKEQTPRVVIVENALYFIKARPS
jgi:hypothetical protein